MYMYHTMLFVGSITPVYVTVTTSSASASPAKRVPVMTSGERPPATVLQNFEVIKSETRRIKRSNLNPNLQATKSKSEKPEKNGEIRLESSSSIHWDKACQTDGESRLHTQKSPCFHGNPDLADEGLGDDNDDGGGRKRRRSKAKNDKCCLA